jgi:hypothetical protein
MTDDFFAYRGAANPMGIFTKANLKHRASGVLMAVLLAGQHTQAGGPSVGIPQANFAPQDWRPDFLKSAL